MNNKIWLLSKGDVLLAFDMELQIEIADGLKMTTKFTQQQQLYPLVIILI